MAAPGYPQMGQMPPGQMPPMGAPMGAMPRPVRRGTSKVVPVVVSAGLAVGVFCGLLFGLGTDVSSADSSDSGKAYSNDSAKADKPDEPAPATASNKPALDPSKPMSEQMPQKAAAGSAAPAGSGSAVAAAKPANAPATVRLTFNLSPDAAAQAAKITVDGKEITGNSISVASDKKSVKVAITAPGYHSQNKTVELQGGDTTLEWTLIKRAAEPASSGTGTTTPTNVGSPPVKAPPKKKPPGGGLIDI
ncbi:MAG TPA: hypothetical protein VMJ10_15200 [Kofleriaceae bacterium]|nr:hypothetical protein [Kofleriaceae bacterium]